MELSNSRLYGKGVFTTIRIIDGKPWLWDKHWRRLSDNAVKVGVDLSKFSEKSVLDTLSDELHRHLMLTARSRLTFSDDSDATMWSEATEKRTSLSIVVGKLLSTIHDLRVGVSPHLINSTSPLAGIKSCNYLEQTLSLDKAKQHGFDEAIRINERGHVSSACMANVFWATGGKVFTPSLSTGCLAGTTREYVLEKVEYEETEADVSELKKAEAIYLTSAGLGIARVAEFDGQRIGSARSPLDGLPF